MKKLVLFFALFSFSVGFPQQGILLETNIKGHILNANTGIVLVKTSQRILAINPKTKKVEWKNDGLKKVDFSSYQEIPFTPYIIFEKKPFFSSKLLTNVLSKKGISRTLVNVNDGKIFFDSEKQGFKAVSNTLLLPEQKTILVDGIKEDKYVVGMYDYASGKELWKVNISDRDFFKNIKATFLDKERIALDVNGNIFWLRKGLLLKINNKTGEIIYNQIGVHEFKMNVKKDIIYVFTNQLKAEKLSNENAVYALNCKTLKKLWKEPTVVTGTISKAVIDKNELIAITTKGFNIINTIKGSKKWKESTPLPLIKKIVPISNGYLVVQENFLTRINDEGKKAWKKRIKITKSSSEYPIHIFDDVKDALYITSFFANKVTIDDGLKVWHEDVVLNKAGFLSRNLKLNEQHYQIWYDDVLHQFPVYNDTNFYIFNPKDSKAPKQPLRAFDFGREIPNLEVRKTGYFLSSNNQYYLFSPKGKLLYEKRFPQIENSSLFGDTFYWVGRGFETATSALNFIPKQMDKTLKNVLVSTNLGFVTNTASSVYGTYRSYQNFANDYFSLNALGMDSNMFTILDRFKKGQKNNESVIIVALMDETDLSYIISLNKDTGKDKILKKIDYEFNSFITDQIEKLVYLFKGKEILIEGF